MLVRSRDSPRAGRRGEGRDSNRCAEVRGDDCVNLMDSDRSPNRLTTAYQIERDQTVMIASMADLRRDASAADEIRHGDQRVAGVDVG